MDVSLLNHLQHKYQGVRVSPAGFCVCYDTSALIYLRCNH